MIPHMSITLSSWSRLVNNTLTCACTDAHAHLKHPRTDNTLKEDYAVVHNLTQHKTLQKYVGHYTSAILAVIYGLSKVIHKCELFDD